MFAVPGWSVSADALKTQTVSNVTNTATVHKSNNHVGVDRKKSRKRKRGHGSNDAVKVTDENLGDLWRRHIEEKSLDQPRPNEKRKRGNQSTEGKDDAVGEVGIVDRGSFEGFSEDDRIAGVTEEEAPTKKKKGRRKEHGLAGTVQANGRKDAAETSSPPLKEQVEAEDGKSKYEQRKAKALKKREQRALLQANGTLPPSRPENVSGDATNNKATSLPQTAKPSKSSEAPDATQKSTAIIPSKISRAPEPPEPSRVLDATQTPALSPTSTKLTPLQQRMAAKLTSARFRYLNQTLYTSPSAQAMRLFADSPQNYTSYHAGFRAQVAVWPQNPVEGFIQDIRARATVSVPSQKKLWREQKKGKRQKGGTADAATGAKTTIHGNQQKSDPLPRAPNGICTIIDLGCGDATLAGSLSPVAKSLNLKLLSFDLAKGDTPHAHLITVANITNLSAAGVQTGTVDIAICCLSLMGTNWVSVVDECSRVVRAGGEVWVAEIKSRFARPESRREKKKPAMKVGVGIGRKKGVRAVSRDDEDYDGEEAVGELEEVEDAKIKDERTDVGAFLKVFAKRGLVLKGEPDVANKMFVRMRFVKSLPGATGINGAGARKQHVGRSGKGRFVDDEEEEGGVEDESQVLKPCVYKTR